MTLLGATIPGKSGKGIDDNKGVLCIPQNFSITEASPSDGLESYPGQSLVVVGPYLPAEMQSVYSPAPADWAW